ncbi:AzlD domain-containing protein [Marasmitruncus massiliensis]|uniref:AzlD domain-containing protein n=1 Tax=Marasmitruncus massiliensis TaxID=1944642 RepID=UPI000C7D68FA|nr:AzlD domain-containing protein [Marasmitruncus massiliensis]
MNLPYILTAVFVMALVTYIPRMLPLVFMKRKIQNRFVKSLLEYVPYAVLAAMTIPDILYATSGIVSALIGLAAALILAYSGKGLLTVALGSTAAVFLAEQAVRLFI